METGHSLQHIGEVILAYDVSIISYRSSRLTLPSVSVGKMSFSIL